MMVLLLFECFIFLDLLSQTTNTKLVQLKLGHLGSIYLHSGMAAAAAVVFGGITSMTSSSSSSSTVGTVAG